VAVTVSVTNTFPETSRFEEGLALLIPMEEPILFDVTFETTELADVARMFEDWSALDAKTLPRTSRFAVGAPLPTPILKVALVIVRMLDDVVLADVDGMILADWSAFDAKTLPRTSRLAVGAPLPTPILNVELVIVRMLEEVVLADVDAAMFEDWSAFDAKTFPVTWRVAEPTTGTWPTPTIPPAAGEKICLVAEGPRLLVTARTLVTRAEGVWKAFEHQTFPATLTRFI
jgi:hypothetical protein